MRYLSAFIISMAILSSCKQGDKAGAGKFAVNGDIKNSTAGSVYLEELYFDNKPPLVLDSATVANGKFTLKGAGKEEGMYRLRFSNMNNGYLFINDATDIGFHADLADSTINGASFSSPANQSFTGFLTKMNDYRNRFMSAALGLAPVDSATGLSVDGRKEQIALDARRYVTKFLDTVKSPALATFVMGFTQDVDTAEMRKINSGLQKRFPKHTGINSIITKYNDMIAAAQQQEQMPFAAKPQLGSQAPDLTMNDPNGKPISISNFKGKYVLVDFWASWCGPCRKENPTVVAAFNKFKSKNFTVLGVSLDEDKDAWIAAIMKDGLAWSQMSDLKGWASAASTVYGVDAIPYNVLLDPAGRVIASDLRGPALEAKLAELVK